MIQHKTNPSLIYIGSTDDLETRIKNHKNDCYNPNLTAYTSKKYKIIRENGGWDAFKIQIIDAVISADKDILFQQEQYYMDKFQSIKSMNSFNAVIDYKAYQAQYRNANADKIKANQAEYYKQNADKIKAKQAQYIKENLDKVKANQAGYYKKNADRYKANATKRRLYKYAVRDLLAIDV